MTNTIKQYDMTDDATRRRIFWLLQRLTSFSLWKRKRDAFAIFANAYENAVKTWPEDDPET
ncbi:Imm71 family immunity protein, partial [Burkholderia ubonensis]